MELRDHEVSWGLVMCEVWWPTLHRVGSQCVHCCIKRPGSTGWQGNCNYAPTPSTLPTIDA